MSVGSWVGWILCLCAIAEHVNRFWFELLWVSVLGLMGSGIFFLGLIDFTVDQYRTNFLKMALCFSVSDLDVGFLAMDFLLLNSH